MKKRINFLIELFTTELTNKEMQTNLELTQLEALEIGKRALESDNLNQKIVGLKVLSFDLIILECQKDLSKIKLWIVTESKFLINNHNAIISFNNKFE